MTQIKISEVTWYPIRPTELGLIGFAGLRFGDLMLSSIAVYVKPDGGYRLVFPDKALPNGRKVSSFEPANDETHELILNAIVKKIDEVNTDRQERSVTP